jgi:protein-L-isoaspartate(D-aspartate) O-methyltransferase
MACDAQNPALLVAGFRRLSFLILASLLAQWSSPAMAQDDAYRRLRLKMVEERIEREGIRNEAVLEAMRTVPRHLFVSPKFRSHAYSEEIIDIGYKQTLSTGYIVAYMTESIDPRPTDRVLEIGTGSGYQAAVLARLVKDVYTIEIVEPLGKEATERLKSMGLTNVHTRIGDGFKGWPEHAPFDKIIVTCSPETVPQPLADQLAEGGKMIIPLGERYQQSFYLLEKKDGRLAKTKLLPTLFVPMTGIAEEQRTNRSERAPPHIVNGGFEKITNDVADGWFYQRQAKVERERAPQGKAYMTFTNSEPGRDAHALQAFGLDGNRWRSVTMSLLVRVEEVSSGTEAYERPALAIRFFDAKNSKLTEGIVGPFMRPMTWRRVAAEIKVPREAHMAMIQIGLRGATGKLSVDDVRLIPHPR